eukprot:c25870_g1_i1 orf=167-2494(+)
MGESREGFRRSSSSPIPWREMFEGAAKQQQGSISPALSLSGRLPAMLDGHPNSERLRNAQEKRGGSGTISTSLRSHSAPLQINRDFQSATSTSASSGSVSSGLSVLSGPPDREGCYSKCALPNHENELPGREEKLGRCGERLEEEEQGTSNLDRESFQLALYIAMAHAGLVLLVGVIYGFWKLLEDVRKPIQWAVLCSMPLREIQATMVQFWDPPLRQGLVQTVIAIPAAICKAVAGTVMDAQLAVRSLLGKSNGRRSREVRFSILIQWLLSFAFFTVGCELMGSTAFLLIAFMGMIAYTAGSGLVFVEPVSGIDMKTTWSMLSAGHSHRGGQARSWLRWAFTPFIKAYKLINTRLTRGFVIHLHTIVAVGLIFMMIIGSLAGLVFFSYKIGVEGKDAVVALKTHLEKSNYAEKVGLKKWMETNNIPELIDAYTAKAYVAVSEQIDLFAAQYNMTELSEAGKNYILGLARGRNASVNSSEISPSLVASHPVLEKLDKARCRFREYNLRGGYSELEQAVVIFLDHFQLSKEDLISKAKGVGQGWLDVSKQVVATSSTLVTGSTNVLFSVGSSVALGAVGIMNFMTNSVVFFSVLFYLITSTSGGVMEHALGIVPLSGSTRKRCAMVLDHTVSSVLLATVKAATFQAVFTWLLFRFLNIHFLYMCTVLAFFNPVLPIFPNWLSSLPAGVQLAVEGHYAQAIFVVVAHVWIMDFGVSAIQSCVPGHNAYLTGLSIAGGMALFSPALEGAIMGPLIMTVLMSLKKLYSEFVLATLKKND